MAALYALPPLDERAGHAVNSEDPPIYDTVAQSRRPVVMTDMEAGETVLATMGGNAFGVYWHLCKRANQDGQCWPSLDDIAEATMQSRMNVTRVLDKLEAGGWIIREKRTNRHGLATSTLYTIVVKPRTDGCNIVVTEHAQGRNTTPIEMLQELVTNHIQTNDKPENVTPPNPLKGEAPPPKAKAERKTKMPEGFDLSGERLAYAIGQGLTEAEAAALLEEMRLWSKSTGGKYLDWDAAWQNWCRRRAQERAKRATNGKPVPIAPDGTPMPPEIARLTYNHHQRLKWENDHRNGARA